MHGLVLRHSFAKPCGSLGMAYRSPTSEIQFILDNVVGFAQVSQTDRFSDATSDTAAAVLTEAPDKALAAILSDGQGAPT